MIDVTTIIDFAARATEGMWSDVQNVEPHEDPDTAATEIVAFWEGEGELLGGRDRGRWEELEPSAADDDELRGRCVAKIADAIRTSRKAAA